MATRNRKPPSSLWQRLRAKLKPSTQSASNGTPEPESTTLPVMDTFEPDTCRMMEIRYTSKDEDFTSPELLSLAQVRSKRRLEKRSWFTRVLEYLRQ